jgi:hypothetical protein
MELLALASNCSRHIDIEKRSLIDILRSDDDMETQVKLLLYPQRIQGLLALFLLPLLQSLRLPNYLFRFSDLHSLPPESLRRHLNCL